MKDIMSIKNKLLKFFKYIEEQEIPNVFQIKDRFKEIFKNDYIKVSENENTAYFQEDITTYYINDSCGISLASISGDMDRFNNMASHYRCRLNNLI